MVDFSLLDDTRVHLIGDPHIGRKFEVGVPVHRKGERELMQLQDFREQLRTDADVIVIVGDLFDFAYVGYGVVDAVARELDEAAQWRPTTQYVVMAGNHDLPRNIEAVGAFHDLSARLSGRHRNLSVLFRPTVIGRIAYFPWEWHRRADEQVAGLDLRGVEAAIGHWDLALFNGKDDHLAPVGLFDPAVQLYSGHYHVAGEYKVQGRVVTCTGSMQPYTHGEDPDERLYVTLTPEEARVRTDLQFMNVRVRVKRGEALPELDALSVTALVTDEDADEGATPGETLTASSLNWNKILTSKLSQVDDRVKDFIYERLPQHGEQQHQDRD